MSSNIPQRRYLLTGLLSTAASCALLYLLLVFLGVATSIVTCSANMKSNFKHGVFELLGKGSRYYN